MSKRPDWSRRLPRPLVVPKVMTLATLADVRELMRHLPADHRNSRRGSALLRKAAAGSAHVGKRSNFGRQAVYDRDK
jgi:hypothetical protein